MDWTELLVMVAAVTMMQYPTRWLTDRRRRWRSGKPFTPTWNGACSKYRVVDFALRPEQVEPVVLAAFRRCGITPEPRRACEQWWLGYTKRSWKQASGECAVGVEQQAPDRLRFWCCARPRYSTILFDFGRSDQHATALTRALSDECARVLRLPAI